MRGQSSGEGRKGVTPIQVPSEDSSPATGTRIGSVRHRWQV